MPGSVPTFSANMISRMSGPVGTSPLSRSGCGTIVARICSLLFCVPSGEVGRFIGALKGQNLVVTCFQQLPSRL